MLELFDPTPFVITLTKDSSVIGIIVEKNEDSSFMVSVAYKIEGKWRAKVLGGLSGNFSEEGLVVQVKGKGQLLDKDTAHTLFPKLPINDYEN